MGIVVKNINNQSENMRHYDVKMLNLSGEIVLNI